MKKLPLLIMLFCFFVLCKTAEAENTDSEGCLKNLFKNMEYFLGTKDPKPDIGIVKEYKETVMPDTLKSESPITLTPNPVKIGQVVIGNEANNVLTIGTNGKRTIKIISVELENAPFEGFSFDTNCEDKVLRGKIVCMVTTKWTPAIAENVHSNFKIIWREVNSDDETFKRDYVPVFGSSVNR